MALRTRMGSQKPKGSGNTVTLTVWVDQGPGTKASVEIEWTGSELGSPAGISPSGGFTSANKVIWDAQVITAQEQHYSVTLQCVSSGSHTVQGRALDGGGTPPTSSTQVGC